MSNHHQLKILNFTNLEKITYPIIKIIGSVRFPLSHTCAAPNDRTVYLSQNNNSDVIATNLKQDKFKFLIQLQNGKNQIEIKFCCETKSVILEYFPVTSKYAVIPLYVICEDHDGCFQSPPCETNTIESACKRITLCSKLLQSVTAEKLYEHQLGRKTFSLHGDCQVFKSKIKCSDARNMTPSELWENVGREIMKSNISSEYYKYLAFLSCTKYYGEKYKEGVTETHEDLIKITEGYVALAGGGLALFGTACLYTWPEKFEEIIPRFENSTQVDRKHFLDDSCFRGTLGACFSTTLGSVLHELFHTFDLGHTEEGIMGRGFDNIYKVFTNFDASDQNNETGGEVQKTFQDKIEFKEEFEPDSLLERLKSEHKKKEFTVIKKFEEIDDTVLSKSCAVILCYHKWFNETVPTKPSVLSFDPTNKLVKSTTGVRVIEIRSLNKEMVVKSWVFDGRIMKFSFQIPQKDLAMLQDETYIIFVENTVGDILKEEFNI